MFFLRLRCKLLGQNTHKHQKYLLMRSRKTEETVAERVESIQNALGKSGGKQLISHEKAIQLLSDDFDIEDPAMMYQKILEENGAENKQEQKRKEQKLTDEHEKDMEAFERLASEFTKQWESFFDGVWNRIEKTEEEMKNAVKKAWKKQPKDFYIKYMKEAYRLGEERAKSMIEQVLQDDISVNGQDIGIERRDIYEDLWEASLSRISDMEETTLAEIRKVLAEGFDEGENWKDAKKKIEQIIKDPVRAERIAITELGWAYNRSIQRVYKNAGAKEMVWHASIDIKTCDRCRERHGMVYPIEKAPENPLHPRCRCTWLPKF